MNNSLNTSYNRKMQYTKKLEELDALEEINDTEERVKRAMSAVEEAGKLCANSSIEEAAKNPSEVYLDSCVLRAAGNLAYRSADAFSGNVNFYESQELSTHIRLNQSFWTFMLPKEAPTIGYLYGTFDPTPREQRPRAPRRVQRQQQAKALKAPATVEKLCSTEEAMAGRVHRFTMNLYKKNSKQPLSYFHLVLDPHSFSSTVENIHYVSFLVHDGLASVQIDERYGLPFITPYKKKDGLQDQDNSENAEQLIISMDHNRWKALIEAFNITEPLMALLS